MTLLFTGLGWVSALRDGVQAVFVVRDQQNVVVLKLADLLFLGAAGILVLVSVIAGVGVTPAPGTCSTCSASRVEPAPKRPSTSSPR